MNHLQNLKHFNIIPIQSIDSNVTFASNTIDTKGYDDLQIVFTRVTASAAQTLAALAVQESDITDATGFASVTGYTAVASIVGGTNTTSALPTVFNIDLRGKKRYFRVNGTQSATAGSLAVTATLGRAEQSPITASGQGCAVVVNP